MSDKLDFKNVPGNYRGLQWQVDALDFLNTLPDNFRVTFTKLWRNENSEVLVTEAQLNQIFQRPSGFLINDLNSCLIRYKIDQPILIAHFLAQCGHESGGGRWMLELASGKDYEGRKDLGNTFPGDGVKYKGAGLIQLTGRYNYTRFANDIKDPRVIAEGAVYVAKTYPVTSAGYWWMLNRMNTRILNEKLSCRQVSRIVNGRDPANGLADRLAYFDRATKVFNVPV